MIQTIADLEGLTPEEIEDARSRINLRGLYYMGVKRNGKSEGLTLPEYEEWKAKKPDTECGTCRGSGLVKEYHRSVGTIHASSAHSCVRRLYYDVDGSYRPKQYIRPELQITFAMGHAIHDDVQNR